MHSARLPKKAIASSVIDVIAESTLAQYRQSQALDQCVCHGVSKPTNPDR
jgi:hypothetical protein